MKPPYSVFRRLSPSPVELHAAGSAPDLTYSMLPPADLLL